MKKVRIIKRTTEHDVSYVVQQKHFLFRWWWVRASINTNCADTFGTLDEAKTAAIRFGGKGTGDLDEIVYENFK